MREILSFPCEGATLAATLDRAEGAAGLLIVSGGNEIRVGAHRGMAKLAQSLAARGIPVFRFDRRGIGDSEGENGRWASSTPDIAAAAAAFRAACPGIERLAALGNCDAATALVFAREQAGIDRLILTNPWVVATSDALPPPAAIRRRYAERLRDPRAWRDLVRGRIDFGKLARGLRRMSAPQTSTLAARFAAALSNAPEPPTIILAERDATAIAFAAEWRKAAFAGLRERAKVVRIPTDSHSFARAGDAEALEAAILSALKQLRPA